MTQPDSDRRRGSQSPGIDDATVVPFAANQAALREGSGMRIGPYQLLQLLGEGGFGSVFLAEQERPVRRKVALKIVKLGMDTGQVVARFEQERQALAILDHPHIAKVFDAGATDTGRPYFVMELCSGEPIDAYCDRNNLSIEDRLGLFAQVCAAVQHAHLRGIIHRDIKPGNVLVSAQDGEPCAKVIDFGIAKATGGEMTERTLFTEQQQMIGTPEYMSPEQAEGSLDIDTRTDVYSLGVMLYQLLTGSTPFQLKELRAAAYGEIQRIIREVDPPRPSTRLSKSAATLAQLAARRRIEPRRLGTLVRGELDWIVMKALEKDRQRRYETANGLAEDVQRYLSGQAVLAAPPSRLYQLRKSVRQHRGLAAAVAAVAAALLVGAIAFAWQAQVAGEQRDLAVTAQKAERERAEGEQAAKQKAEARLGQIEKANEILGAIFKSLDPKAIAVAGRPLQALLAEKLEAAGAQIEGSAIGDPLVVANMQNTLAASLLGLGEARRAIPLFERSLVTRQAQLGTDHADTIDVTNNLAVAWLDAGQPERALPLLEAAQQLREARFGLHDPNTLAGMKNLAGAYFQTGNTDKAMPMIVRALALMRAALGPDAPDTLACMNSVAAAHDEAGRPDLALPLYEEAHARQGTMLGRDHPDTLQTAANLAAAYVAVGQVDRAVALLEDCIRRARAALGDTHPVTLTALAQLGTAHWTARRLDRSIPLFEEVLRGQTGRLGRTHPTTLGTVANLGINYAAAGRPKEALPLLEEAYAASAPHPELGFVFGPLIEACVAAGEDARAAELFEVALAQARRDLPADSRVLATLLARLGETRLSLREWDRAEVVLRECLDIRGRQDADAWWTCNAQSMLGGAMAGQGRFAAAEPLLLAGFEGMLRQVEAIPPEARPRVTEAARRLVRLYADWHTTEPGKGHDAEAAAWQAKVDAMPAVADTPPAGQK